MNKKLKTFEGAKSYKPECPDWVAEDRESGYGQCFGRRCRHLSQLYEQSCSKACK